MDGELVNVYCDESCHMPRDGTPIMTLGAVIAPQRLIRSLSKEVRDLKSSYRCAGELKWTKVSAKNLPYYLALIDFFTSHPEIGFRALVVHNKSRLDHARFNDADHDSFYFNMYYYLIRNLVENRTGNTIRVYVDIKDSRSSLRISKLHAVLANAFYDFEFRNIQRIQQIRSHESELMQLCDFLLGAVTYSNRKLDTSAAKLQIVRALQQKIAHPLDSSTPPWESKFNLFHFVPRGV